MHVQMTIITYVEILSSCSSSFPSDTIFLEYILPD